MRISFFFNDTATTEIYTLSLHDALPIFPLSSAPQAPNTRAENANTANPVTKYDNVNENGESKIGRAHV